MTVRITRDRLAQVLENIRSLERQRVLVGIPSSTAGRTDVPITNAVIGYIQENGDPERNIPARPFLVPGAEDVREEVVTRLRAAGGRALDGDPEAMSKALHAIGLVGQNAIRARINAGPPPPLAPLTLANRRARGRTGEKPLIDTGQLRSGITYVIRQKGAR